MLFLWIILYGIAHLAADTIALRTVEADWVRSIFLAGYTVLFLLWIVLSEKKSLAGLDRVPRLSARQVCALLPLGVFPVCNLAAGGTIPKDAAFLLEMLCVSVTEELFFRGFLLSDLRRRGVCFGIVGTSLLFAMLHCVNFFSGGSAEYVLLQMLSSFIVSICYCAVVTQTESLLPCIGAHFLTNITGTGTAVVGCAQWFFWLALAVYVLWGGKLCYDLHRSEVSQKQME